MKLPDYCPALASMTLCLLLSGCAGTETLVATPAVELRSVELVGMNFSRQTFLLGFDVQNPNAFPLPVKAVRYRVSFDDERLAGGETSAAFTVPARGAGAFQVSVELDLLNSASQLTSLLRGGVPDHVRYRIDGSLAVDLPFTAPLSFASSGVIQIQH